MRGTKSTAISLTLCAGDTARKLTLQVLLHEPRRRKPAARSLVTAQYLAASWSELNSDTLLDSQKLPPVVYGNPAVPLSSMVLQETVRQTGTLDEECCVGRFSAEVAIVAVAARGVRRPTAHPHAVEGEEVADVELAADRAAGVLNKITAKVGITPMAAATVVGIWSTVDDLRPGRLSAHASAPALDSRRKLRPSSSYSPAMTRRERPDRLCRRRRASGVTDGQTCPEGRSLRGDTSIGGRLV